MGEGTISDHEVGVRPDAKHFQAFFKPSTSPASRSHEGPAVQLCDRLPHLYPTSRGSWDRGLPEAIQVPASLFDMPSATVHLLPSTHIRTGTAPATHLHLHLLPNCLCKDLGKCRNAAVTEQWYVGLAEARLPVAFAWSKWGVIILFRVLSCSLALRIMRAHTFSNCSSQWSIGVITLCLLERLSPNLESWHRHHLEGQQGVHIQVSSPTNIPRLNPFRSHHRSPTRVKDF